MAVGLVIADGGPVIGFVLLASGSAVSPAGFLSVAVRRLSRTAELRADRIRGGIGGSTLHMLVLNESGAELGLCFGHAHRIGAAVDRVDLNIHLDNQKQLCPFS